MAGGPHAQFVPCMTCMWEERAITKATRISEGIENDHYVCEKGHQFGIDYDHGGPPSEPQWPPKQELIDAIANSDG